MIRSVFILILLLGVLSSSAQSPGDSCLAKQQAFFMRLHTGGGNGSEGFALQTIRVKNTSGKTLSSARVMFYRRQGLYSTPTDSFLLACNPVTATFMFPEAAKPGVAGGYFIISATGYHSLYVPQYRASVNKEELFILGQASDIMVPVQHHLYPLSCHHEFLAFTHRMYATKPKRNLKSQVLKVFASPLSASDSILQSWLQSVSAQYGLGDIEGPRTERPSVGFDVNYNVALGLTLPSAGPKREAVLQAIRKAGYTPVMLYYLADNQLNNSSSIRPGNFEFTFDASVTEEAVLSLLRENNFIALSPLKTVDQYNRYTGARHIQARYNDLFTIDALRAASVIVAAPGAMLYDFITK